MLHAEIQSFLAICRYKTLTTAASQLYITQSSLSLRLRSLEQKVGSPLFYRKKGGRELVLTSTGVRFLELALRYEGLVGCMEQLNTDHPFDLKVSSLNSVSTCLLLEVYQRFLDKYPDTRLNLQDMGAKRAYESILKGTTDLAFITSFRPEAGVFSMPAFKEPMVLLCADSDRTLTTWADLPVQKEVYIPWGPQFTRWHQKMFSSEYRLTVTHMDDLQFFLSRKEYWAIVPLTVAEWLNTRVNVFQCQTPEPLPSRDVYLAKLDTATENPAIAPFLTCLREVLSQDPRIKIGL